MEKILDSFALTHEKMLSVSKKIDDAMTRGQKRTEDFDIRMFPTYISAVPNSKERGRFLSLDLGVSRLVISLVELRGKHITFKKSVGSAALDLEVKCTLIARRYLCREVLCVLLVFDSIL